MLLEREHHPVHPTVVRFGGGNCLTGQTNETRLGMESYQLAMQMENVPWEEPWTRWKIPQATHRSTKDARKSKKYE